MGRMLTSGWTWETDRKFYFFWSACSLFVGKHQGIFNQSLKFTIWQLIKLIVVDAPFIFICNCQNSIFWLYDMQTEWYWDRDVSVCRESAKRVNRWCLESCVCSGLPSRWSISDSVALLGDQWWMPVFPKENCFLWKLRTSLGEKITITQAVHVFIALDNIVIAILADLREISLSVSKWAIDLVSGGYLALCTLVSGAWSWELLVSSLCTETFLRVSLKWNSCFLFAFGRQAQTRDLFRETCRAEKILAIQNTSTRKKNHTPEERWRVQLLLKNGTTLEWANAFRRAGGNRLQTKDSSTEGSALWQTQRHCHTGLSFSWHWIL